MKIALPIMAAGSGQTEIQSRADEKIHAEANPKMVLLGGRFEVRNMLAMGGMGHIYEAWDRNLDRQVVIKLVKPGESTPDAEASLLGEIRIAARLRHPNLVGVLEAGVCPAPLEALYMVMPLAEGTSLDMYNRVHHGAVVKDREEQNRMLGALIDVLDGLSYAHAEGVAHRDVKPHNIMIGPGGKGKLLDFGVALDMLPARPDGRSPTDEDMFSSPESERTMKIVDRLEAEVDELSCAGELVGSVGYIAPEMIRRAVEDPRLCDIYSAGAVLYEILTGAPPWTAVNLALAIKNTEHNPENPLIANPGLDPELARIAMKALDSDPRNRYQTADEMREELRKATGRSLKHACTSEKRSE